MAPGIDTSPRQEDIPFSAWVLAWYGLVVLIIATVFAAIDRQILVLLAEPMRQSLGLSDTKLGLLQGAGISLFAGIAAVPIGWLADRFGRKAILAACVLVWSAATAACGLAWDFPSLFAAAIGLGIGEAGLAPIVYGLIPDMIPARKRVLANGIYAMAAIFGGGLGIALSGSLIEFVNGARHLLPVGMQQMEPWRLSFLAVAVPGPIVAAMIGLIQLKAAAQARAAGDGVDAPVARLSDYLREHWRTVAAVFGGTGMGGLGIHALAAWAPIIAARNFHATPQEVGQGIGAGYLIGTAVGAFIGGFGVRRLRPIVGVATPLRVLSIGMALSAFASAGLLWATSAMQVYVLFGLQVTFLISGTVVAPNILQEMSPAEIRSRVIAFGSVIVILLSALSPVLVGLMSDALHGRPDGLLISVAAVATISLVLGAFFTKRAEPAFTQLTVLLGAKSGLSDAVPPPAAAVVPPVQQSNPGVDLA